MGATSKDGSKVDLARKTWVERLTKATTTPRGEDIVYNKIGVWLIYNIKNAFKMS